MKQSGRVEGAHLDRRQRVPWIFWVDYCFFFLMVESTIRHGESQIWNLDITFFQ